MPRYFFHFRAGSILHRDATGIVLDNSAQALDCALELATTRITDPDLLCDWGKSAYEIESENGSEMLILSMSSVLARMSAAAEAGPSHRWLG